MIRILQGLAIALFVFELGMPRLVQAQKVGTTSFQFLKVLPDARAAAMGETPGAAGGMSAAGVFVNPASYAQVQRWAVNTSYTRWIMDVPVFAFAAAFRSGSLGSFGIHARHVGYGEMDETTVDAIDFSGQSANPGFTGQTFSPYATQLGLTFARELTDKFSFGLSTSYIREDLIAASAQNVSFDGGLIFRTGFRSVALSAAVRNFGPEVTFREEGFPMPQTFDIGLSAHVFSSESALLGHSSHSSLLIAANLVDPRDYGQQYNVGAEYSLHDRLFFRGGYQFDHDTASLGLGFGLDFRGITVDYAYNAMGEALNPIHRFAIGLESR